MTENLYYRRSGKIDVLRLLIWFTGGVLASIPLALLYAAAVRYIPIIYVNALFTLGLAAGAGFLASLIAKGARSRNHGFTLLIGLAIGVISLWFAWAYWVVLLHKDVSVFSVPHFLKALNPSIIQYMTVEVAKMDNYLTIGKAGKTVISGYGLYTLWAVEGLVVVLGSTLIAFGLCADKAFCERCRKWTGIIFTSRRLDASIDYVTLREELEAHQFASLLGMGLANSGDTLYIIVEVHSCGCGETFLLSVIETVVSTDDKGKESTKRNDIVSKLYISREELEQIRENMKAAL